MNIELTFAIVLAVGLLVLIVCVELRDRRKDRDAKKFFERAIRVNGTVTDFGLKEVESAHSQRFCAVYEIDGKQYSVDSGLIAKWPHVYEVGEKVTVYVDSEDHSKAKLPINGLRRSLGIIEGK